MYRERHRPLCKAYLTTPNDLLGDFAKAQVSISAVSADTMEQARQDVEAHRWMFPVGCGLTPAQMAELGL